MDVGLRWTRNVSEFLEEFQKFLGECSSYVPESWIDG